MNAAMIFGKSPRSVADYILRLARENNATLTPMQLLKLVYISHGWNLGLHSQPLIDAQVQAWQYGPVVPQVYHRFKKYGAGVIKEAPAEIPKGFSREEDSVLRQVFNGYGKMTGIALSSLTHETGGPWEITVRRSGIGAVISTDLIEEHYRRLANSR